MLNLKRLSDSQLVKLDMENYSSVMYVVLFELLRERGFVQESEFMFLDIGGGNGLFADKVLNHFPLSSCVVVEYSRLMCDRNVDRDRKVVTCCDAVDVDSYVVNNKSSVVFMNWFLHHLVSDSYGKTVELQLNFMSKLYDKLPSGAIVVVVENVIKGYLSDNLSSRFLYHVTSSKFLSPLTKTLGANSAGVGVCYHDENTLTSLFKKAGFCYIRKVTMGDCGYNIYKIGLLATHSVYISFFIFGKV